MDADECNEGILLDRIEYERMIHVLNPMEFSFCFMQVVLNTCDRRINSYCLVVGVEVQEFDILKRKIWKWYLVKSKTPT